MENIYSSFLIKVHILLLCFSISTIIMGAVLVWVHPAGISATSEAGITLWDQKLHVQRGPNVPQESVSILSPFLGREAVMIEHASVPIFIVGWMLLVTVGFGFYSVAWRLTLILDVIFLFLLTYTIWCIVAVSMVDKQEKNVIWKGVSEFEKFVSIVYTGNVSTQTVTIVDYVQARLQCCGAENGSIYADQDRVPLFRTNSTKAKIPVSCCKVHFGAFKPLYKNCTVNPTTENSNYNSGCLKLVLSIYTRFCQTIRHCYIWVIIQLFFIILIYFVLGFQTYKMILL